MTEMTRLPAPSAAPTRAGLTATVQVLSRVIAPPLAVGIVKRRPLAMALAELVQADRAAIRLLQRLRADHGPGPLKLSLGGRSMAVLLSEDDLARVLEENPVPFSPDTAEKRSALARFQPHGVLVSRGRLRWERRDFNEVVLETDRELHHLAGPMASVIGEEMDLLAGRAKRRGGLTWDDFEPAWWRTIRRIVFGDAARDDRDLTAALASLRRSANWLYVGPRRTRVRQALAVRLRAHLDRAAPGSLAAAVGEVGAEGPVRPEDQVAHWLFAFDGAAMTVPRTLALLAVHPTQRATARGELASVSDGPETLPYLRACALEALRLWPTTPLLLRESTEETNWGGLPLREGTTFVGYTPLFQRDGETLDYADDFVPEIWTEGTARRHPGLAPFSAGPARCPGREVSLFCVSTALAHLLRGGEYRLASRPPLYTGRPAPATLDPFSLVFTPATEMPP